MSLIGTQAFTEDDEEVLLEELREVAHIDEETDSIVVFASPTETSAIGRQVIVFLGGWLLDRRRQRRQRADDSSSGGQSKLAAANTNLAM